MRGRFLDITVQKSTPHQSIQMLPEQPYMGPSLDAIIEIETDYRYLLSGNYYIFYKFDGTAISIYRIIYMRCDIIRVLFG